MKKAILAAIILFFCLSYQANENTSTYYLKQAKMSIKLPSDWMVITPYLYDTNPVINELKKLEIHYPSFKQSMQENHTELTAVDPLIKKEVIVTVIENDATKNFIDYRLLSKDIEQKILNGSGESIRNVAVNSSVFKLDTETVTEVLQNKEAKYFMSNQSSLPESNVYTNGFGGFTVVGNKLVAVNLYTSEQDTTQKDITQFKEIIRNIQFDKSVHEIYETALNSSQNKYSTYQRIGSFLGFAFIPFFICLLIIRHKRKKLKSIESI